MKKLRPVKESDVTPPLREKAVALKAKLRARGEGAEAAFELEGVRYIARAEAHKPSPRNPKPHIGVTLYYAGEPLILPGALPAAPPPRGEGDVPGIVFRQARNYTRAGRTSVSLVVIHTAECKETANAAENLALWAAGANAPRASWHYAVDADSATQSVRETDVAWHAPGVNRLSIGIEQAGRAGQLASEWDDAYSRAVLERTASLVAGICMRWNIPIRRLTPRDLVIGAAGICGHVDVRDAFQRSTHWDPGPNYPWTRFIEMVRAPVMVAARTGSLPPERPTLGLGAKGPDVAQWQRLIGVQSDGDFGPITKQVTIAWQVANGLKGDGVVGPKTWAAADRLLSKDTDKIRT